jgi:hypothetical protein
LGGMMGLKERLSRRHAHQCARLRTLAAATAVPRGLAGPLRRPGGEVQWRRSTVVGTNVPR